MLLNSGSKITIQKCETPCHVIQTDTYNCGAIILYLVENLLAGESLTAPKDFDEYRNYLKKLLLQNSDDMRDLCLYCSMLTQEENIQCKTCFRICHIRCLLNQREMQTNYINKTRYIKEKIYKGVCGLCEVQGQGTGQDDEINLAT